MGNVVITRCVEHPNTRPLTTYQWPTQDDLEEHAEGHDEEVKTLEEINKASDKTWGWQENK